MTQFAPVDARAIEFVLAPFGQSRTLPADAYTSPEVFAWEQIHFFEDTWVCVGREGDFEAGTARELRIGVQSLVVVRPHDGPAQAYYNVCRHRGHEILPPGEVSAFLRCPYHGWSYRLDGTLRAAPRFSRSLDKTQLGLTPARTERWRGWVFVNVSEQAPSLVEYLGNLVDLVDPYGPEGLIVGWRIHYEVAANWKLVCENYHECYHCSSIHPELCVITPPDSGRNLTPTGAWVGGTMELRPGVETMSLDGSSPLGRLPGLPEHLTGVVGYFGAFPNLLISLHPDYVMTHRLEPLGPGSTLIDCCFLFPQEAVDAVSFDPGSAVQFWDLVNRQDWEACESVQRGMTSRGFRTGLLAPNEDAVYQFESMVALAYRSGGLRLPPPPAQSSPSH